MQNNIELQKNTLELLNLQIAKIEAERDSIQKDIQAIGILVAQRSRKPQWYSLPVATVSVLLVIALSFIFVFHNALSNVNFDSQSQGSALSLLEPDQIIRGDRLLASNKKLSVQTDNQKIHFSRNKTASQQQWGPSLVMPKPDANKRYDEYDPLLKAQQENLLALGFDVGKADGHKGVRTRQAITEFRSLYLPDSGKQLADDSLAPIMENYANLARSDAAEFGVDQGVVAAIRLSSVRTGVDFSYLMKLAATESDFKPASKAATSSATGLYQFTRDTWLRALKMHGAKYGLVADYAANIEYKVTRSGYQRPFVSDQKLYEHLLGLRKNPRISAMMAAETVRDNQQKLVQLFDREPTETDLYLTHFLGAEDAIIFLRSLQQSPGTNAVELFPEAARSNRDIFHPKASEPRTVDEVYALFGEKFTSRRYDN